MAWYPLVIPVPERQKLEGSVPSECKVNPGYIARLLRVRQTHGWGVRHVGKDKEVTEVVFSCLPPIRGQHLSMRAWGRESYDCLQIHVSERNIYPTLPSH